MQTYRYVDVVQTGPTSVKVDDHHFVSLLRFQGSDPFLGATLTIPGKTTFPYRNSGAWGGWVFESDGMPSASAYLKRFPPGAYAIRFRGRAFDGKTVRFRLPNQNLLNPSIPYFHGTSYQRLVGGQINAAQANTLTALRKVMRGKPFATLAQPSNNIHRCFVQIRDDSRSNPVEQSVWHQEIFFSGDRASFTIPAGQLRKNRAYQISLQTDHTGPEERVQTPDGKVTHRYGGINFYELDFRTRR